MGLGCPRKAGQPWAYLDTAQGLQGCPGLQNSRPALSCSDPHKGREAGGAGTSHCTVPGTTAWLQINLAAPISRHQCSTGGGGESTTCLCHVIPPPPLSHHHMQQINTGVSSSVGRAPKHSSRTQQEGSTGQWQTLASSKVDFSCVSTRGRGQPRPGFPAQMESSTYGGAELEANRGKAHMTRFHFSRDSREHIAL